MSVLAKNIRLIRRELQCTQSVMAEILNIGFRTYVRYEAGERDAPIAVLVKLACLANISLERLLTQVISRHDISPGLITSEIKIFPETKLVNFRRGEIVFKKPLRQELMTIDSSEKRLLTLFRKMDVDLQRICLENIQQTVKAESSPISVGLLKVGIAKNKSDNFVLRASELKKVANKRGRPGRKKLNEKLLKEKIDRLKMVTKSISKTTVK